MVMEVRSCYRVHPRFAVGRVLKMAIRFIPASTSGGLRCVAVLGSGSIQAEADFLGMGSRNKLFPVQSHFPHANWPLRLGDHRRCGRAILDDLAVIFRI